MRVINEKKIVLALFPLIMILFTISSNCYGKTTWFPMPQSKIYPPSITNVNTSYFYYNGGAYIKVIADVNAHPRYCKSSGTRCGDVMTNYENIYQVYPADETVMVLMNYYFDGDKEGNEKNTYQLEMIYNESEYEGIIDLNKGYPATYYQLKGVYPETTIYLTAVDSHYNITTETPPNQWTPNLEVCSLPTVSDKYEDAPTISVNKPVQGTVSKSNNVDIDIYLTENVNEILLTTANAVITNIANQTKYTLKTPDCSFYEGQIRCDHYNLPNGNYLLSVDVSDVEGIAAKRKNVFFTVDADPPLLTVDNYSDSDVSDSQLIELYGTVSSVGDNITKTNWVKVNQSDAKIVGTRWYLNEITLHNGDNAIEISAGDQAGNITTKTIWINYQSPAQGTPKIYINTPVNGEVFTTASDISLTATVTNATIAPNTIEMNINGTSYSIDDYCYINATAGTIRCPNIPVSDKTYIVTIDCSSTTGQSAKQKSVLFFKDNTAPVFSDWNIQDKQTIDEAETTIDLFGKKADNVTDVKTIILNGWVYDLETGEKTTTVENVAPLTAGEYWFYPDVTIERGKNELVFTILDGAGNTEEITRTIYKGEITECNHFYTVNEYKNLDDEYAGIDIEGLSASYSSDGFKFKLKTFDDNAFPTSPVNGSYRSISFYIYPSEIINESDPATMLMDGGMMIYSINTSKTYNGNISQLNLQDGNSDIAWRGDYIFLCSLPYSNIITNLFGTSDSFTSQNGISCDAIALQINKFPFYYYFTPGTEVNVNRSGNGTTFVDIPRRFSSYCLNQPNLSSNNFQNCNYKFWEEGSSTSPVDPSITLFAIAESDGFLRVDTTPALTVIARTHKITPKSVVEPPVNVRISCNTNKATAVTSTCSYMNSYSDDYCYLTWGFNSKTNIGSYNIHRISPDNTDLLVHTTGYGETDYYDRDLKRDGSTYTYYIQTVNSSGDVSASSANVTCTVSTAPLITDFAPYASGGSCQ